MIGAGHNGLVCAAYLAKAGQKVLLLEASNVAGGLAAQREFHAGFHTSVAHSYGHFSRKVASDLNLAAHGLATSAENRPTIGLNSSGDHVVLQGNTLAGTSANDEAAFERFGAQMRGFADLLAPFWSKPMPPIGSKRLSDLQTFAQLGFGLRRRGRNEMQEFLRIISLPARDLMDEYFDNAILKAVLSWDGLIGSRIAPRSPNSAVLAILYRMAGASHGAHITSAGSVNGLIDSLRTSAAGFGTTMMYDAEVARILVAGDADGQHVAGVELANGEKFECRRVLSAVDPKTTFLSLVGAQHLDIGFTNRIRRLRCDGLVAKLHLALNSTPEFKGLEQTDGRMILAADMDAIEFAFDDAKYGECPKEPVMEIVVPSIHDTSLAPAGQHTLSAHIMYVPHRLTNGWTSAERSQMCEKSIDAIEKFAPRIREQILHREFLTPADLEREYRVTGGHWHHTEFAMDQMLMMRPTYEAAQYRTPIPGLFLCSAGCHPGGDLVGAAGHNAALEVLK